MKPLWIYAICINVLAFLLFGIDKSRAVHHAWRIRESTLILCAAAGGSAGALVGMLAFHHKTRKPLFAVGIPLILAMQVIILVKSHNLT